MDNNIISGFGGVADNSAPFTVDFTKAELLDRSGSTCDAYEATVQRRRVFVKRLKAEYRDNPLYRAAFDKEYDLGVSLSHPSLPRYVGYGDDYVVMDFIEGDTLADLIQRGDSRLRDRKFVRKLLSELIDVAEYLHNRNVVHCDIKADNIMISPYSNRPATLIDLDKAYSPWLDSTHGNAGNYGCDSCADGAIDIKGIGMIASKLGMKRIADACDAGTMSLESLGELTRKGDRSLRWILPAIGIAALAAGVIGLILHSVPEVTPEAVSEVAGSDSITVATVADASASGDSARAVSGEHPSGPLTKAMEQGIDPDWIASLIAKKVTEYRVRQKEILSILECDTISVGDKRTAIMDWVGEYGMPAYDLIHPAVSHYYYMSELEVQTAVRSHPAWIRLEGEGRDFIERLIYWNPVESQHSSDRHVSQPDTVRDDTPVAQHR